MRYIIPPASSGTAPGSPPCWSYLENLQRGGAQGASWSDLRTTSAVSFRSEGAAALLRAPTKLSQAILWRKLISITCAQDLKLKTPLLGAGVHGPTQRGQSMFFWPRTMDSNLEILTNHLAANLLDAWLRTQTKEASRNMSSTKSRDATLRFLNGTLSWTSFPWISQTEIKKDNILCAFDFFIFVLWYQKRYGVFFYAGIVWKLRILLLWQPYLRLNFISWWDSVNPFSRQSSSAPVNLCDAGPQPVTQPPLGPLTFLGLSFSQLPLFSRCSVQKNWRQPWRCHCSAWVVATTTTWWESCELSSKSSVMLGFMTIVPRGRKEGSRQP